MACKKRISFLPICIASVCFCSVLFFTGCASGKQVWPEEAPEPAVLEPVPEPEPTLAELAAALDAEWTAARAAETAGAADVQKTLFTAPVTLPAGDRLARKHETALGSFLADAERGFLSEHGIKTDFAFINAELIRAGLQEGPVTKQDIERVLPFGQKIAVAEMSGAQLLELFAFIGTLPQGAGGFAQVSDGVTYTLTFDETGFGAFITDVLVGGEPVEVTRTYRIALNDFVAAGGNGYSFFLRDDVVKVQTAVNLADGIADYCLDHADLLYIEKEERITIQGGISE